MSKKITVYDLVLVGLMAAIIFVSTAFLKIGPIPHPGRPHPAENRQRLCLLAGLLFGGWRGGLAAGIGSMLYDLSDPAFVSSAPTTLLFFFLMGACCGFVSHLGGPGRQGPPVEPGGAISGSVLYLILHLGKSMLALLLAGSSFQAAVASCAIKFVTSGINAVFAVVVAMILAPIFRNALERAGLYARFSHPA